MRKTIVGFMALLMLFVGASTAMAASFMDRDGNVVEYTLPSWVDDKPTGDVYYCGRSIYRIQYEDYDLLVNKYGVVWRAYKVEYVPQVSDVVAPSLTPRVNPLLGDFILAALAISIFVVSALLIYRQVRRKSYQSSAQRWLDMISERELVEETVEGKTEVLENIGTHERPIWVPIRKE